MTNAELRLHRQVVKRVDPSLPHRGGRAYAKLERGEWKRIYYAVTPKGRAITIHSVVRPQPDLQRLTRAVLRYAEQRSMMKATCPNAPCRAYRASPHHTS